MGLVKRGDTFHFRCRVPSDLTELLGRVEIHATLRTDTRRIALQREEVIQANLAIWFQRLRIARETSVDKSQLAALVECLWSEIGSSPRRRASAHGAASPKRLSELMKLHLREKEGVLTARSLQKMTYSYRLAFTLLSPTLLMAQPACTSITVTGHPSYPPISEAKDDTLVGAALFLAIAE